MFDSTKVCREDFANPFSYKAALWLGEKCNELLKLKEAGFIFFYNEEKMEIKFNFMYGKDFMIGLKTSEHCTEMWCGDSHAEIDGEWKVWCTKKELTEILKRITILNPKHLIKMV